MAGEGGSSEGHKAGAYLWLALMVLIGSSTAPAARFAVELPIGLVSVVRFGAAGLCLLPLTWRHLGRLARDDGGRLALAAACCVPINQTFFLNASRLASTAHVALIYATCPLVVLALAVASGQERLAPGRLLGILASVSGVALVVLENLRRKGSAGVGDPRGDLLLVGAVVSWGVYLTVNKPLVARHGALPVLAGTFLGGALLAAPVALATFPGWPAVSAASPAAWRGLAYLVVVVSALGLACQNLALRGLDASQVAAANNAATLLTLLWGAWLFGEMVTPALAVGAALILGGVVWTERPAGPQRTSTVVGETAAPSPPRIR